jgi:2-polyprenyl-3-methyl-5-hydroxy-6-metoxy-1,4-benzoquinol methylase
MCGEKNWRKIASGRDFEYQTRADIFEILECLQCQHVYLHPMPALEEIGSLYPLTYYTINAQSPNYIKGFILDIHTRMGAKRTLNCLKGRSIRSIVDVGCGNAHRLFNLADTLGNNVQLIGLDLQHEPSTVAKASNKKVLLVTGNVESDVSALSDWGCDFIIMNQVIEHLQNPVVALEQLHKKLSPGGLLLIETPNVGGIDYSLFKNKYWGHWHIPRHLNLFTQKSLTRLVVDTGFEVVERGYLPSPGPWILSFRNLLGLNSIKRNKGSRKSLFEFICFQNLFVVGFFTCLDLLTIKLGIPSSTQFLVARKSTRRNEEEMG